MGCCRGTLHGVFLTLARTMLAKGEKSFHRQEVYKDVRRYVGPVKKDVS